MHATSAHSPAPEPESPAIRPDTASAVEQLGASSGAGPVSACLSSGVLRAVLQPATGLALWRRPARPGLNRAIQTALALPPFSKVAEGPADQAARALVRDMPLEMRPLGEDMAKLGRLFASVTQDHTVRFRLEHVADNACRQHHVDAVGLRLLCTYAGLGTEWIHPNGQHRRMSVFHVGLFKGSKFPDTAPRILHRSPPVEHLPERRRSRLLLCIDQPGVF
jgi:hypothetical protein